MEVNWGNVESYSEVQSVNGLTGKVQLNIPTKTSDLINDSGFVSNSNFATKAELKQVENKIPNVSNFATKSDVSNSISVVEKKIPSVANLATKEELTAVEQKIPIVSGFATKQELNAVQSSIPDISGLATKVELSNVAANIPETYLEVANLGDGSLTIINNKGESVVFTPSTGGGGTTEKEWLIVTADIGTVEIGEVESYSTLENVSATKEDIKAAYAAGQNILLKLNDTQIMGGIIVCMPFSYTPINDSVDIMLVGTLMAAESFMAYSIFYGMEDDMWSCSVIQIEYLSKSYADSLYVDKQNTLPTLATKAELSTVEAKIPNVSNFATTSYVETAITNKGYQTQIQVQALINDAISNIKNANEVSY